MFCPGCGKESLANQRFCKSCGCDLGVVSQVLSTKGSQPPGVAQPAPNNQGFDLAAYNKLISKGYKELATGGSVMLAVLFIVFMLHETWMRWAVLGMMIWGASSIGNGISKVIAANQMKQRALPMPNPTQQPVFRAQTTSDLPQYAPPQVAGQPYDQVSSVTEQTTRKLENPN